MRTALRRLFKDSIVIFVAGALLSVSIELVLGGVAQRYMGILLGVVSVFSLYAMATLREMRKGIDDQLDRLGLTSFWIYEPDEANESYQRASEIIRSAEHSLLVLSVYASESPRAKMPQGRPAYYVAIEKLIESRLEDPTCPGFVYKRILQSDKANEAGGTLSRDLLHEDPPQTFEHCRRISNMLEERPGNSVAVDFLVSDPIPSFPSMLLVDDRYALFALITKQHRIGQDECLMFGGALIIEDRTGRGISDFKRIFSRFSQDAKSIYHVEG